MADIQIEKLVFVKLSESIQKATDARDFDQLIRLSKLCITHIILSGTGGEELKVIAKEMEAYGGTLLDLRLKATLERGIRLA